jgi:hypothetical protein
MKNNYIKMFSKMILMRNISVRKGIFNSVKKFLSFKNTPKSFAFTHNNLKAFSTAQTTIKVIETISDHKPPIHEDTIGGRYASTLFIVGSKAKELYRIFEDMKYISSLYQTVH